MKNFTVDARDSYVGGSACPTCCCQPTSGRPNETNKWQINYAPWSLPIGGKGLAYGTDVAIEIISTCPPSSPGDPSPDNTNYFFSGLNGPIVANVTTNEAPPGALTYSLVPLTGPRHGTLAQAGGIFTYTPQGGYLGYDSFYYKAVDISGRSVTRQVIIQVLAPAQVAANPGFAPPVNIPRNRILIDVIGHSISFPVEITPAARECDIYRITVRQPALDCDGNCFYHVSCYDLSISKC